MILGHLPATFLIVKVSAPHVGRSVMVAALVGCYLPDIIDKGSVKILGIGTERGLGHTLLFHAVLISTSWHLTHLKHVAKYKLHIKWLVIGSCLHLAEDLVRPLVLFWPLLGEMPPAFNYSLVQVLRSFYWEWANPPVLILEMLSHMLFLGWLGRKLVRRFC